MEINSYLLREAIPIAVAASGAIGLASATVDVVSAAKVSASAAGLAVSLPAPTDARSGRSFLVINSGTQIFTVSGLMVLPDHYIQMIWDNGTWHSMAAAASGGDHDWYEEGTGTAPASINDAIYTRNFVGVNGTANYTPKAPLQIANNISNAGGAADFNSLTIGAAQSDGFDQFDEYQALYWDSGVPNTSIGTGVEGGSLVDNVGSDNQAWWRAFRFGGVPKFGVRGDGWIRGFDYGKNLKNNGSVYSALVSDQYGYFRERPASDGNPSAIQGLYGGGWLWGGWSPIYTANTGYVDEGWVNAFAFTAPQLRPGFTGRTWSIELNGNFGQKLNYQRECITREFFGWRLLVNGVNFGTRASAAAHYQDERTNLGNETINKYIYKPAGSWNWARAGIPPGASCVVQYNHRHQITAAQPNAYARFISGVYRNLNVRFSSSIAIAY